MVSAETERFSFFKNFTKEEAENGVPMFDII